MTDLLEQPFASALEIVTALLAAAFVVVILLAVRRRRTRALVTALHAPARVDAPEPRRVDAAALTAALSEAEAAGQRGRLPGLYLSLARCNLDAGATAAAEDLLRKCIHAAAGADAKEAHAGARLALGDIAHKAGDLATACEHWQIARSIFFELKRTGDHDAAEARMLRNGCPTDWVLTDF